MKFSFRPSPNYRAKQSTSDIMRDVTICLLVVLTYSAVWHGVTFGGMYAARVILMAAFAVVSALLTEVAFYAIMKSKNIWKDVTHSYGWITALIIALITKIDVSYYAIVLSTVIAIVFGKLVFGGFGQNIFNPAAFGEAIIMNSFSEATSSNITDVVLSGATPMTQMGTTGWAADASAIDSVVKSFGGLGNMFMGNYASVLGGSCALIILLCGIYLIWRKDIDWRLTCTYILTIFIVSLIVGIGHGTGLEFALFNVLGGGVMFGAVFMLTDPVTTPVTIPGKFIFAIGAGCLTLVLRWRASIPDGVLFSILLMNMLTPAIDKACDGNQIKDASTIRTRVIAISCISLIIALLVGATLPKKDAQTSAVTPEVEETTGSSIAENPVEIG